MANTYTLISSNTLSASAASVTFSSIPSTYTDLVLKVSVRSDRAAAFDNIDMRLNGDTGANYSSTRISSDASSVSSTRTSAASRWDGAITDGNTSTSNTFSNGEYYLPNYTSSAVKPASFIGAEEENNATAYMRINAYLWNNTAAITSIVMTPSSGTNWLSGSSFYLYGIKNRLRALRRAARARA